MIEGYEEESPQQTGTNFDRVVSNEVNHSKNKQVMQKEYTINDKMKKDHQKLANRELERVMFIKQHEAVIVTETLMLEGEIEAVTTEPKTLQVQHNVWLRYLMKFRVFNEVGKDVQ
jgi:hypothetical protein